MACESISSMVAALSGLSSLPGVSILVDVIDQCTPMMQSNNWTHMACKLTSSIVAALFGLSGLRGLSPGTSSHTKLTSLKDGI